MHFQNKLRSVNCSYFKTILCRSAWNFHCVFLSTVLSEKNLPIASGHPPRLVLLLPAALVAARDLCTLAGICARRAQTDRMLHAPRVNNTTEKPSARRNREAKMTPTKIAAAGPLSQQHDSTTSNTQTKCRHHLIGSVSSIEASNNDTAHCSL